MNLPKILTWATGGVKDGGSGFENLVGEARDGELEAEIVGVVSNHAEGGVYQRAKRLNIPFIHFPGPWTAEEYKRIAKESGAEWHALSGWVKLVTGLEAGTHFG